MNLFLDAHRIILTHLIQADVEFIIIGGYSVIFHGYHRTTGDVDIWLNPVNANKIKLIEALRQFGIEEASLSSLDSLDFQQHSAFHIGEEPGKVEFLTRISGVTFEEAFREKVTATIDDLPIPILHLDHLIRSKMSSGRLKDLADVEELQKIRKQRL